MHAARKLSGRSTQRIGALALLAAMTIGCGPKVFQDASAMAVVGTPPPEAVEPEPRVKVTDNKIVINEKVQFEYDSAKILPVSHDLLNEVASVIKQNPHIKEIQVEGHASAEGNDDYNMKLSDNRANSVRKYLSKTAGIPKDMLTARGYGETQPIADNETEEGRERNRRVEFTITRQEVTKKKVEVAPDGSEKIINEETVTE